MTQVRERKYAHRPRISASSKSLKGASAWRGSGFHARLDLDNIDGRSKTGKTITVLKKCLRDYVVQCTPLTELLIGRIIYKTLKLMMYESACLQNPQNAESAHYLPMANSLRLDLQTLAGLAGEAKPPDLSDYLKLKDATKGEKQR